VQRDYRVKHDVIRYVRMQRHWSQQKLAEKAGMSLGQISRIESGKIAAPHFPTIEKIATALDIEEDDLIEVLLPAPK
jgi:transcriptional regulator with XRE-family HTH domain